MQEAVQQYTNAVEAVRGISPVGLDSGRVHAVLLANRAQCFVATKRYEDALTDCSAIIDENPPHLGYATPAIRAKALCRMALAFKGLEDHVKACDAALRAHDQGSSMEGLANLMTSLGISLHSTRKDRKISDFFELVREAAKGCAEAREKVVHLLNTEVFRVDERAPDNASALKLTCDLSNTSMAKLLLERRAQPHQRNERSRTPLMFAARSLDIETCKLLLREGASINSQDENGWTALLTAFTPKDESMSERRELQEQVVDLLLSQRADVNHQTHAGDTALILACMSASTGVAARLVKYGAEFGRYLYGSAAHPNKDEADAFVETAKSSRAWPTERESLKAHAWSELLNNELRVVHNQSGEKALASGIDQASGAVQQLRDVLGVLLRLCNLPGTARDAVRSGSNPLFVLHKQLVEDMMPAVMRKSWSDAGEISEDDAMTMIAVCGDRFAPLVRSNKRGKLCANESCFREFIYGPVTSFFCICDP
ncbi:Kidins220 [Symbiodinium sp. CCMP2592]|nr:Kidins220 [Symbiodinium sp. CCMP2592]